MALSEEDMCALEDQIPMIAVQAMADAYTEALAAGHSVLIAEDGYLCEVFPDGRKERGEKIHTFPTFFYDDINQNIIGKKFPFL